MDLGIFDKIRKKEQKEIFWKEVDNYAPGLTVEQYIKRLLILNPRTSGIIYLNDKAVPFNYGNLGDIVDSSLMPNKVSSVQESEDGDKKLFKINF